MMMLAHKRFFDKDKTTKACIFRFRRIFAYFYRKRCQNEDF